MMATTLQADALPREIVSVNPATGEVNARYPEASSDEVEQALQAAEHGHRRWSAVAVDQRVKVLLAAANTLREQRTDLARLITAEMGKPIREALAEVEKCAWVCDYYATHAPDILADEPVATEAASSFVRKVPIGAVLAVMPWNFPLWQVFRATTPALAAGNSVVLKHASSVPGAALAAANVWRDAGLPEGVFQTVLIGSEAVPNLIADPRVRAVTFTGSTDTGAYVAALAARAVKKQVLELGGSDPFIVLDDADLEQAAAAGALARVQNAGQSCIAAKRFIVHESVADEFVARVGAAFDGLTVGNPLDPDTDIGPLARSDLIDTLLDQVNRSVAQGALVIRGGTPDGPFFPPTLIDRADPAMPVCAEETFGPVAAVIRVAGDDEAINVANATSFGLGASVWTRSADRARRFIDSVEAGATFVNRVVASDPRLPIGGVKRSGYGRELGAYGLMEFVALRSVWIEGSMTPNNLKSDEETGQ